MSGYTGACLRLDVGLDGLTERLQWQDAEWLLDLPGMPPRVKTSHLRMYPMPHAGIILPCTVEMHSGLKANTA